MYSLLAAERFYAYILCACCMSTKNRKNVNKTWSWNFFISIEAWENPVIQHHGVVRELLQILMVAIFRLQLTDVT